MASFEWPPQGGAGGGGVSTLNGLTGALTLVAGTGITITPSGSNLTIATSGFANTTLSNLTAPTAVNQDLIPGTDATFNLGNDLGNGVGTLQKGWANGCFTESVFITNADSNGDGLIIQNGAGATIDGSINSTNGSVNIQGGNLNLTGSTGSLYFSGTSGGHIGGKVGLNYYNPQDVTVGQSTTPVTFSDGGVGTSNINIGYQSTTGTGNQNTVIGTEAQVPAGSDNTCVGYNSGPNTAYTGNGLTSVGANCGNGTTGTDNTYMGASVVSSFVSSGSNNAFFGNQAGSTLTTGSANVLMGASSGTTISTGSNNVLIGNKAGNAVTTDQANTAVGQNAMGSGTGSNNAYFGMQAGYQATGSNNTFIGATAGSTGLGLGALTGNANILLGYQATPLTASSSQQCVFAGTYEFFFYGSQPLVIADMRAISMYVANVSGTNQSANAGSVNWYAAAGTGTGSGGDTVFNVAPAGSSGSTQNAWVPALEIANTGVLTLGNSSLLSQHVLNTATSATASGVGTLTNLPTGHSGNPTGYIQMTINGSTHVIPYW